MKPAPPVTRIVFKFGRGGNLHSPVRKASIGPSIRSLGDTGVTGVSVAAGAILYGQVFGLGNLKIVMRSIELTPSILCNCPVEVSVPLISCISMECVCNQPVFL